MTPPVLRLAVLLLAGMLASSCHWEALHLHGPVREPRLMPLTAPPPSPATIEKLLWEDGDKHLAVWTVAKLRMILLQSDVRGQKRWFKVEGLEAESPAGDAVVDGETLTVYENDHWRGGQWVRVTVSKESWFSRNISPAIEASSHVKQAPPNAEQLTRQLPEGIYRLESGRLHWVRPLGCVPDFFKVGSDGDYYITRPGLGVRYRIGVAALVRAVDTI